MMRLLLFLMQSEDLKKQSERIVQEVRTSSDAKKFADDFINRMSTAEVVVNNLKFQKEQMDKINGIRESLVEMDKKIDRITTPGTAIVPVNPINPDVIVPVNDDRKNQKK